MISTRSAGLLIDTVVCLTLAKWETVSGRFGGYLRTFIRLRTSKYSFAVIEISKIEPRGSLVGLDQEAQQHLVSTTFGSPSEARDLVGGPYHAVMPRALRGRFEPLDHFVLGHLSILGPLSPLGSPHAAKRFIGLAIGVRTRSRALRSHLRNNFLFTMRNGTTRARQRIMPKLFSARSGIVTHSR